MSENYEVRCLYKDLQLQPQLRPNAALVQPQKLLEQWAVDLQKEVGNMEAESLKQESGGLPESPIHHDPLGPKMKTRANIFHMNECSSSMKTVDTCAK